MFIAVFFISSVLQNHRVLKFKVVFFAPPTGKAQLQIRCYSFFTTLLIWPNKHKWCRNYYSGFPTKHFLKSDKAFSQAVAGRDYVGFQATSPIPTPELKVLKGSIHESNKHTSNSNQLNISQFWSLKSVDWHDVPDLHKTLYLVNFEIDMWNRQSGTYGRNRLTIWRVRKNRYPSMASKWNETNFI